MKKKRSRRSRRVIQAACLAVGLTLAGWGGGPAVEQAKAAFGLPNTEVSGTISPGTNLTDIAIIYSLNSSGSPSSIFHGEADDVPGGSTGSFSFTVGDDPSWYDGESYTVIGVYDENGDGTGDSVCIGGPGIVAGNTWGSLFSDAEATVVGWLQADNWTNLNSFYMDNFNTIAQDIGSDIPLWNFSDATANGTAHAESRVVPLPAAVLFLGSGLLGLAAVRRRKNS